VQQQELTGDKRVLLDQLGDIVADFDWHSFDRLAEQSIALLDSVSLHLCYEIRSFGGNNKPKKVARHPSGLSP